MSDRFDRYVSIEDVMERAFGGDIEWAEAIAGVAEAAGGRLSIIGSILNPGIVIVAGAGAAAGPLLFERLTRFL
ncbi:hypothetical protein [Bradyrhizobium sp.]|uniref:hypothetical protein n=1 Tax=Bradyrhizobium sp. TaxID=376 RepID=UPI001D6D420B|nr:hypothetical protein [Bradyrhizobium sp.]MBV8701321.1 hypothetical protein [Bradyrhizobium sp.]MBV8918298.1 hypothetical protein [Bradyrhizobium sp.]MBV9981898.1 hypothetical protein [Bradyrhizobium sp.]